MENSGEAPAIESSREIYLRLMTEDSTAEWEKKWEEGETKWDLGVPTPIISHLIDTGSLPNGKALVPGCGTGYDVLALACPDRYVVGLDISKTSVERSIKMFSTLPNAKYFSFLCEDFFTWESDGDFDLIFDYTFFCAFEPALRPLWAQLMDKLLKPGGELITLMYPIDDRIGGPAYKVSAYEYQKVLIPLGFEATSIEDNELAVGSRKGKEKIGRWKKTSTLHSIL
ncbi:hypothetical protein AALP_AA4G228700 [Arabis alpina]|uniref:Thiol methyltransferase 2 n=1 Tax=Arabis alpina TaxID=50452 RepID=A0A087H512_ARAAL|nr:hypothetical protein AALP_AA4G228700 [Arabis alpina]